MGIVIKQTITNTIITYIGFAIGAINTLYLYVQFLGDTYYGLVSFILGTSNIMMPLMILGVHNTLVKYYNEYKTEKVQSNFLTFILFLPFLFVIPFSLIGYFGYHQIAAFFAKENPIVYNFMWQIPIIGLFMGYFELFYAWVKVHFQSILGNFIKEVFVRILVSCLLISVYFDWISPKEFVFLLMGIYCFAMFIMMIYAFRVKLPAFSFASPQNYKEVIVYSLFIILSGGIANMLLEIDKLMLNSYLKIENLAYYSVAIFIASVIAVPSRAMHQITYPITAKLMSENKFEELDVLYKKSSITLQVIGGFIFLLIILNINQLYFLLPSKYSGGILVVFFIGLTKYLDLILGNNNAIIFNSKYYNYILFIGIAIVITTVLLNMIFIPNFGIEGAAIATLISMTLYAYMKLFFVVRMLKLFPFTLNTIKSFLLTFICFLVFYFWDFPFSPLLNIALKSVLISLLYFVLNYFFKISSEINLIISSSIKKIIK